MQYEDLMKTIRQSERESWLFDDDMGIWTLRQDLDIRIHRRQADDVPGPFEEPWAVNHPDPKATPVFYDIYYRSSFVETFMLIRVDGGKAAVPPPEKPNTTVIAHDDYQLAVQVDTKKTLDEYIKRSGLTVEPR